MRSNASHMRGFSLIELVIVTVVLGILAAILTPIMFTSLNAYNAVQGDIVVLDKLRYATERLAREIRETNYNNATGFAFASMGANSTQFTRSFSDSAGNISMATVTVGNIGTAVTLAYSAPVTNPAAPVLTDELNGAGGLVFTYYDQNGCDATNTTAPCTGAAVTAMTVRSVDISLTLSHNGQPYTQTTRAELKRFVP